MTKLYGFRNEASLRESSIPVIREENDTWYLARNPAGRWVVWEAAKEDGAEFTNLNAALLTLKNEIEFQIERHKRVTIELAALHRTVEGLKRPEDAKDLAASMRVLSKIEELAL